MRTKFIYWRFKDKFYYPIRQYFKNIWKFRKELSNFYDWNYDFGLFRKTIELNKAAIEKYANEVPESRLKKVAMMERAIYLLKCFENENFVELAENELGYKVEHGKIWFEPCEDRPGSHLMKDNLNEEQRERNNLIFTKSREIEDNMWKELWKIIQGQDYSTFKTDEEMDWNEQFDGSGLLGWWD